MRALPKTARSDIVVHKARSHEGWAVVSFLTLEEIKHILMPHW